MLFHFLNFYVEKKILVEAVAYTMILNTALIMTNLSLNSPNWLFSCSGIGLLIGFLDFHPIKIKFVKPEACAIIFSYILIFQMQNKKFKILYTFFLLSLHWMYLCEMLMYAKITKRILKCKVQTLNYFFLRLITTISTNVIDIWKYMTFKG